MTLEQRMIELAQAIAADIVNLQASADGVTGINQGGTGATTVAAARTALGINTYLPVETRVGLVQITLSAGSLQILLYDNTTINIPVY